ncbi:MAG TPA: SDR family oxidoreductase [Caulobacteraceae bacterium]|nr:SDR family oxidoreductase [Caulobacteraceae bacterium]
MSRFADQVAIVTGGGMGLGRALCEALAKRGSRVLVADIDAEAAADVAARLVEAGGTAKAIHVDISKKADVQRMVDEAVAEFGRLDYMFNNAAIAIGGDTRDLTIEHYDRVIGVDLLGVVYGAVAAYQAMAKQGGGHIINVSSLGGIMPQPGNTPYSASKWGVVGLSLGLRFEGADLGVKVTCVCPGDMKTDIYKNLTVVNLDKSTIERDSRRTHFLLPQWTAERAALTILAGVERNRAMIVFPWIAHVIWFLHKVLPGLIYWISLQRFRVFRRMRDAYIAAH